MTSIFSTISNFVVDLEPHLKRILLENHFLQAGLLGALSALLAYLSGQLFRRIVVPLFATMSCSITIDNSDPNYDAVIDYIGQFMQTQIKGANHSLKATTQQKKKTWKDWIREELGGTGKEKTKFDLRPDSDDVLHTLIFKGRKIEFTRKKQQMQVVGHQERPFVPESLTLSVWGSDNSVLKEILENAVDAKRESSYTGLNIYVQSSLWWASGWELALTKKPKPKDSVILDLDDMEMLLNDAKKFLEAGKWYTERGIPYRRGYLLYGPPGCGKTSFAQVLASDLKLDICMMNLTHGNLSDDSLAMYLREAPTNSIIVLEDVDAVFVERNQAAGGGGGSRSSGGVSFSGLLNAIDGVAAQEGRIFFMTTNHLEKLDPALIRPGRCDVKLELKRASKLQMEKMFLRFFPGEETLAKKFAAKLPANELSMATLQGHFLRESANAQQCVDNIAELLQVANPLVLPETKSIFDHLRRVGLERYAALFEFLGYMTTQDLATRKITVDELVKCSMELKFDSWAQDMLTRLLNADEDLMKNHYALATISTIREAFLSAYPTDYQKFHGEISPFLRRESSIGREGFQLVSTKDKAILENAEGEDTFMDEILPESPRKPPLLSRTPSTCDPSSYIPKNLNRISRELCDLLSHNGRGVISLFQLRHLLGSHPNRPAACLAAARKLVEPRSDASKRLTPLTLYAFLKRATMEKYIHDFNGNDVNTVEELLKIKDVPELKGNGLSTKDANFLLEIMENERKSTGHVVEFALHFVPRIIHDFLLFYSVDELKQREVQRQQQQQLKEKEEKEKEEKEKKDSEPAKVAAKVRVPVSPEELEELAFNFAVDVSDGQGRALVSLLEIKAHFLRHSDDPFDAISTVKSELLQPKFPEASTPPPRPECDAWVYRWLKAGERLYAPSGGVGKDLEPSGLEEYADSFIGEEMAFQEDFILGPLLDDQTLKDVFGVKKLGHRRSIIRMHEKLKQQAAEGTLVPLPPSKQPASQDQEKEQGTDGTKTPGSVLATAFSFLQ